jgi:SAM-dependent methyltransferase
VAPRGDSLYQRNAGNVGRKINEDTEDMTQFYISGLAYDIDEPALRGYLTAIGMFDSLEIVHDLATGESRGYAILRVADRTADEVASKLEGACFHDSIIHITPMPATLPGEMALRDWLQQHAENVLRAIGIKQRDKVLDYGCGSGIFTIACAHIVGGVGKVYALDVRMRALERVRDSVTKTGLGNIETILQSGDDISIHLPDNSLDVVFVFDVMHDIKDKSGLLKEVYRVLKVDGFLSVFPMHWGNEPLLRLVDVQRIFKLRDNFIPLNSKSPSTILNFVKCK